MDIFKKVPETLDVKWVDRRNIGRDKGEIIKLSLGFGDNTQVQITIGNILPEKKRTFTVTFEKGILVFNDLVPEKLKRFLNNQQYEEGRGEVLPFSSESPLSCVIRTFSNRLKKHKSHLSDLRLAVQITSILNEAQNMLRLEKP